MKLTTKIASLSVVAALAAFSFGCAPSTVDVSSSSSDTSSSSSASASSSSSTTESDSMEAQDPQSLIQGTWQSDNDGYYELTVSGDIFNISMNVLPNEALTTEPTGNTDGVIEYEGQQGDNYEYTLLVEEAAYATFVIDGNSVNDAELTLVSDNTVHKFTHTEASVYSAEMYSSEQ